MAADAWVIHDRFKEYMGDNTIDMDGDAWEVRLYTSASNIATTSIGDATTATNELSGSGYTAQTVAGTWNRVTSTVTFDSADAAYTASGGSITARFAAVIDTTTTPDEVVCHSLLDNTPADVTVTDGNTLTVQMNASGIFTLS
tara:strand:+ start:79 stop:507 length:429 start_codon:yes stop_codon:yes gene_type:complete